MKLFYFLILLCFPIYAWGQEQYYCDKAEQEALKKAYKIIKVYYPTSNVCASDSVFDIDRFGSAPIDDENKFELYLYRLNRKFTYDTPVYSKTVATLLQTDTCKCNDNQYFAEFSVPYKGYIACNIMPKDRKVGIYSMGAPYIYYFVFKFDEDGEIYHFDKRIIHFD